MPSLLRQSPISLLLPALLLSGCQSCGKESAEGIEPSEIVILQCFVGKICSADLNFRLDGQNLENPDISLVGGDPDAGILFSVMSPAPLGVTPNVSLLAPATGDYSAALKVKAGDREFLIPVTAHVRDLPMCNPEPEESCRFSAFDTELEQCVLLNKDNSVPCDIACQTVSHCQDGTCIVDRPFEISNACPQPSENAPMAVPAWKYPLADNYEYMRASIGYTGTVDDEGTTYFVDFSKCRQSGNCGFEAVDKHGQRKWRRDDAVGSSIAPLTAQVQILVAGDAVVFSDAGLSPSIHVRRRSDGELLWSQSGPANRVVLVEPGTLLISRVELAPQVMYLTMFDLETGADLRKVTIEPVSRLTSLIGDGAGTLYASYRDDQGIPTFASIDSRKGMNWKRSINTTQTNVGLAGLGEQLFVNTGHVLNPMTGMSQPRLLDVSDVFTLVVNENGRAFGTVTQDNGRCGFSGLSRFEPPTLDKKSCAGNAGEHMVPTQDGGVAVIASYSSTAALLVYDQDFALKSSVVLTNNPAIHTLGTPFYPAAGIVDGRVLVVQMSRETEKTWLASYDVPGLVLSSHGWVGIDGSPLRNGVAR